MKLKLIERSNERGYTSFPKVSVSSKGTFYVNSKAMELMGISKPQKFQIFQDEINTQKWFIHFTEKGYITLSPKSEKDGAGQISAADIAQKITESFHHEGTKSLKFKLLDAITIDHKDYWPLEVIKESIEMKIPNPNAPARSRDTL